jgi:lysophospholipase L1-like esterase
MAAMKRLPLLLCAALLLGLALPVAATAKPAEVRVGKVGLSVVGDDGGASLLVPVRYPIEMAGHNAKLSLRLREPGKQGAAQTWAWRFRERVHGGRLRRPDRRRHFTYVHQLNLSRALMGKVREGLRVEVVAEAVRDADRNGKAELRSRDRAVQKVPVSAGGGGLCSSVPRVRSRPGKKVVVELPACASARSWDFVEWPRHGRAVVRGDKLVYHPPKRFRGTQTIELAGYLAPQKPAAISASTLLAFVEFPVTVGTAEGAVVRALGDSVTAGFGYYSDGSSMTISRLPECRPGVRPFNDACSSNSLNRSDKGSEVEYATDYGLSNNVSWAAQWANFHGIADFKNFAISGSEPADWAPGGEFHATTARIESEDPDYILLTMGANPLLSEMLFGADNMGCAIYSDVFGGYRECVEEAFAEVHLRANLKSLYTDLVANTEATIYPMQYHLSVPSVALAYSATQIAAMGKLLNREIEAVAAEVNPRRLQVVTPPHFDVGIDISPVFSSRFSCSELGYKVDGPSVQSTPTQDELEVLHPLSFCEGPEKGPPWVIGGDTGIHPSAAGYQQMAGQVPPPS